MAVVDAEEDLENDEFDFEVVKAGIRLKDLLGVGGQVIQDQGKFLPLLVLDHDLAKVYYVRVLQLSQQEHLSQNS